MSTQANNSKQSLQVKVTNRVDIRPNVAARYRLQKLNNINIGQERRFHVYEILVQRKDRDNNKNKQNGLKLNSHNLTKNNGSRYYYSFVNP